MSKYLFFLIILIGSLKSLAQDKPTGPAIQILANWMLHDNKTYTVTENKFKVIETDTVVNESIKYDVFVEVYDSTSTSYTVEWTYDNFLVESNAFSLNQLSSILTGLSIKFKTDELGIFDKLINYNAIQNLIKNNLNSISDQFESTKSYEKFKGWVESEYLVQTNFETKVIKDILQFHQFHGTELYDNETYFGEIQVPNIYGGEPFDTDITFWLEDNDFSSGIFEVKMQEVINSKQLTQATYDFMKNNFSGLEEFTPDNTDLFPTLTKAIFTTASVHESGWVIQSVQTSETRANKTSRIEVRKIELK
ncbi:hypothetical protein OO013_05510 [Mangrovivirga sp. M17]|uniref:Uncharacterized protein n=1 Tax=Mangrovivirga halotolerans TaxID=2993936 RepID=A0ABT3RNX1_9BACT|nr:hypothetical protein [Mangrovivirga halotolerans]MCX2743311.1 hypothetical protein [Mangrovivirga halotolerans]